MRKKLKILICGGCVGKGWGQTYLLLGVHVDCEGTYWLVAWRVWNTSLAVLRADTAAWLATPSTPISADDVLLLK